MLIEKIQDYTFGNRNCYSYSLTESKLIEFTCEKDNSIEKIKLVNAYGNKVYTHFMRSLCYMENITIDDGRLLNIDELLKLAEREDASC